MPTGCFKVVNWLNTGLKIRLIIIALPETCFGGALELIR